MILAKDFLDFIHLLHKYKAEYMIVGGYALAFHGKPRHTGDLDIWINMTSENAARMIKVVTEFGLTSMGIVKEDFLKPGYVTQIGYPPLRIDILNTIDGVLFQDAVGNLQKVEIDGTVIKFIGLNDFIANKSASGRPQDIVDVKGLSALLAPAKKMKDGRSGGRGRKI